MGPLRDSRSAPSSFPASPQQLHRDLILPQPLLVLAVVTVPAYFNDSQPQFEIMAFPFSAVPMVLSIPTILPYYPGSNSAIAGGLRDPTSGRAGNVAMAVSQTEAL
jgi:hypothetical protein